MTLLSVINGSTYLKKDNSLRKRSKCVKITRYVEQTLGEKSILFGTPPALKRTHGGVHEGGVPSRGSRVRRGAAPALIVVLVWLLRGRRLHQFVTLGGSDAHAQLHPSCVLCVSMQWLQTW